jgi:prolyl-tRNA editing enzyme YbaK/EbsC (Cys-tRNA(Pro) deacylase)
MRTCYGHVVMSEALHPNVVRVVEAGRRLGLDIVTRRFPEGTKTAQDAAAAIGVSVGQIVKSLVFAVDGEIVMAYVSGANQLDEKKLAAAAGGTKCSRVDADTVREATGFPIGGVPPFGHSGLPKPMVAFRRLVMQPNCACLLIRTCCNTTRCGLRREHGTTCSR